MLEQFRAGQVTETARGLPRASSPGSSGCALMAGNNRVEQRRRASAVDAFRSEETAGPPPSPSPRPQASSAGHVPRGGCGEPDARGQLSPGSVPAPAGFVHPQFDRRQLSNRRIILVDPDCRRRLRTGPPTGGGRAVDPRSRTRTTADSEGR